MGLLSQIICDAMNEGITDESKKWHVADTGDKPRVIKTAAQAKYDDACAAEHNYTRGGRKRRQGADG